MSYKPYPVNIVGGTYKSRSLPLSSQSCINLYPEYNPSARSPTALQNFFGCNLWLDGNGGDDRGTVNHNGVLYQVEDTTLYKISSTKVKTTIGTIAGTRRCIFASASNIDGTVNYLIIVTGAEAYQYDGTTLTEITDADLESPDTAATLNNQLIYDGNNGRWVVATAADPDDIPDNNYAIAESNIDDLVRVYVFNQTLYLMSSQGIETWFNSGSGNPPMTRIEGGVIAKGLYAVHSVANTVEYVYFLDSDRKVSRLTGYQIDEAITPPAIANAIGKMSDVSDAIGMTANFEGQNVYIITFPTGDKTFMYSETFGVWSQLSYGTSGARHLMNSYQNIYGLRLVSDYRNGNIYNLDENTFTDNGDVQIRERVTPPINAQMLGIPGHKLMMEYFEIFLETGVGISTGQGSDPEIMFSTSIDGGKTFDQGGPGEISIGASGDYLIRVRYDCIMNFVDLVVKIRVSDPVFISIHSAFISLEPQEGY